jgi:GMP synthase (glutamine-hydrolysing)
MAKALGVKVYVGQQPEIGWFKLRISKEGGSDVLFKGFSPEVTVFEWHHDSFKLPINTYRLASSELYQNQVFRIGRNAYALQFHPEVDEELIRSWIEIHREELRRMSPNLSQKILMDTKKNLKNYEVLSKHIIKSLCRREICK